MIGNLSGKVAVVTGSARGLGKEMALTLAGNGADIVVNDIIDMKATAAEVKKLGRKAITVKADVTRKSDVEKLFDTAISSLGKVDILVNNAGVTRHAKLFDLTEEDWDIVMAVNLKSSFLCTQAAARHMKERKYGRIINISSVSPLSSKTHGGANYQCAKMGVVQLTRVTARELGPYNITVNSVAPGFVVTEMTGARRTKEQVDKVAAENVASTPMGRLGTPQDIANAILFFASDEASFVTGQLIAVDGGWS
ncbi:MAG: 3-oxoacyl-ACP reductase FabG [Chloroflexi bacterium]|nr:3-oxoacyl-ACP reductase FabG [Chloroflexota bacterium]